MSDPNTFEKLLNSIRHTVRRFGSFRKRWVVMNGLAVFTIIAPGALLAWFLFDWVPELLNLGEGMPYWLLLPLFVVVCGLWAYGCVRWLLKPQLRRINTEREALVIEGLHGELDNSLIGSLQLGDELRAAAGGPMCFAPALVRELVRRSAETLAKIRTKALVDLSRAKLHILGAVGIALVVAACAVFAQAAILKRTERLFDAYAALLDMLFPVTIEVESGDLYVVRGRSATLSVRVNGARRRHVRLLRADLQTGEARQPEDLVLTDERASFEVAKANSSFAYHFEYARRPSDEYSVFVEDLPEIKTINYEMTPPAYTGLPTRTNTGRVARLKGLIGTTVLVNFTASTELHPEMCYITWQSDRDPELIDISGRFGSFSLVIEGSDRVSIPLTGSFGKGFEMPEPLSFDIAVQRDKPPSIRFITRNIGGEMSPGQANGMALAFMAKDDFGVKKVFLDYEVETMAELSMSDDKRKGKRDQSFDPPRDRVRGKFSSIFSDLQPPLDAGDTITITLRAKDNNAERPGFGYSDPMVIELFNAGLGGFLAESILFGDLDASLESILRLQSLKVLKREGGLGETANKIIRTEERMKIPKETVRARSGHRTTPEDGVAQFFELMSNIQQKKKDPSLDDDKK